MDCDRLDRVARTELLDPCLFSLLYILLFSLKLDPTEDVDSQDVDSSCPCWSDILGDVGVEMAGIWVGQCSRAYDVQLLSHHGNFMLNSISNINI